MPTEESHGLQPWEDVNSGRVRSTHVATNPIVEVDGDVAAGRWQYLVINDREDAIAFGQGYYEDEYRREGGRWRIVASTIYRNYAVDIDPADVTRGRPSEFFEARPYLERA